MTVIPPRFGRPCIYPVIHVPDLSDFDSAAETVLDQAARAIEFDIAGVFLIDHAADHERLLYCLKAVRRAYQKLFLGANFIREGPVESLERLRSGLPSHVFVDALWTDNACLTVSGGAEAALAFRQRRGELGWRCLHFGGVAFKYQTPVADADLCRLGEIAAQYVDVATTSGPSTGRAADRGKLERLRSGLKTHPLALASGVTPENVACYVDLVDHILVSTGISDGHDGIDKAKLAALMSNAHL